MKKKWIFIASLIVIIIFGSLHTFNTTNLLMSDIANIENKFNFPYVFVTFAHLPLSLTFILYMFFIVRGYDLEPKQRVYMAYKYSMIQMGFGLVGFICSILSGTVVYHSFLAPYPYPGAIIVSLILNLVVFLCGLAFFLYIKIKKIEKEKKSYKKMHILRTVLMSILTFIAFNRFGALLAMGYYTEWQYLYLTIWFYLSLPLPLLILIMFVLFRIRVFNKMENTNGALIVTSILTGLSFVICLIVMILGMNNPILISLISPAMPLERLATIPFDFIFIVLASVVPCAITLVFEIKKLFKVKKLKEKQENN